MPAEPGALIKYMRTQICTFCQSGGGFPTEMRGQASQIIKHHRRRTWMANWNKSILFWETQLCFYLFLCPLRHIIVFCVLAAAAITAGVSVEKSKLPLCLRQRETEAWFLPCHSQCILLWCQRGVPCCGLLTFLRKERFFKKRKQNFFFSLTLLLWSARPSLKSVLALSEATNWAWRKTVVLISGWVLTWLY